MCLIPAIVATIKGLAPQGNETGLAVFERLMDGLQSQLGGMSTAFSASLMGLAGSLLVGLFTALTHSQTGGFIPIAGLLAATLALVLQGRAREELLDTYETERKPIAAQVIWAASALHEIFMGHGKSIAERMPNWPKLDEVRPAAMPGLWEIRAGNEIRSPDLSRNRTGAADQQKTHYDGAPELAHCAPVP